MPDEFKGISISAGRGTHAAAASLLPPPEQASPLLDIPCGSQALLVRLAEAGYKVHGADIDEFEPIGDWKVDRADMCERLPFEDGHFGTVMCVEGIEHISRQFDFVRECRRIIRPGGTLILTTPNVSSLRSRWRFFITGFHNKAKVPLDEQNPHPRHHIAMVGFPELRYMLHSNGFRIEKVKTNRIKGPSWIYLPWIPLSWVLTAFTFRKELKTDGEHARGREIRRTMFSRDVLFGESLVLRAVRES